MSMNPEQEDFQDLRRLLVLKRHEQPPPGYFNDFSSRVIARIQAGEATASWLERAWEHSPWLQQIWSLLGARPALAGGFGLAVCGLLVAGVIFSEDSAPSTMAVLPMPDTVATPVQVAVQPAPTLEVRATPIGLSSTGVLPQATPSLFQEFKDQQQRPLFQRVEQTYVVPGR